LIDRLHTVTLEAQSLDRLLYDTDDLLGPGRSPRSLSGSRLRIHSGPRRHGPVPCAHKWRTKPPVTYLRLVINPAAFRRHPLLRVPGTLVCGSSLHTPSEFHRTGNEGPNGKPLPCCRGSGPFTDRINRADLNGLAGPRGARVPDRCCDFEPASFAHVPAGSFVFASSGLACS